MSVRFAEGLYPPTKRESGLRLPTMLCDCTDCFTPNRAVVPLVVLVVFCGGIDSDWMSDSSKGMSEII